MSRASSRHAIGSPGDMPRGIRRKSMQKTINSSAAGMVIEFFIVHL